MDFMKVKNILLDESFIDNIICRNETQYANVTYELVIHCDLILKEATVPIVVGIPYEWRTRLFDFYVQEYEAFPFIPHLERHGKLCLYDMEGILIDDQFDGLLVQCLKQAAKVISEGICGKNRMDFISEFDAYWTRLLNCGTVKFAIPEEKRSIKIYYRFESLERTDIANTAYAEIPGTGVLRDWRRNGTLCKGSYIIVKTSEYIFPPDPRKTNLIDYVNKLLSRIPYNEIKGLFKSGDKPLIIFEIMQPNGQSSYISVFTKKGHITKTKDCFKFEKETVLYPLNVKRIDKQYLIGRVDVEKNSLKKMKVLIIGAGSIGGFLATFLARTGCEKMTIVDFDCYVEENVYRHTLGRECVGKYKAVALAERIKTDIPSMDIAAYAEPIEIAVQEGTVDFAKYDVAFSVTGNHNVNRWINNWAIQNELNCPIIYAWNEPLDIGYHTAIVKASSPGSFGDLFNRDNETGELIDITAFCAHNQKITKNMAGCGGSYIPYGSEISIQAAIAALDLLKRYSAGRIVDNEIVSYKGDGFYFKESGLMTTSAFEEQCELIKRWRIVDLL